MIKFEEYMLTEGFFEFGSKADHHISLTINSTLKNKNPEEARKVISKIRHYQWKTSDPERIKELNATIRGMKTLSAIFGLLRDNAEPIPGEPTGE